MQELLYVTTGSPLFKNAHAIQVLFTCKHLSKFFDITIVYPLTFTLIKKRKELKKTYKEANIKLRFIPTTSLGMLFKNNIFFILDRFLFSCFVFLYLLIKRNKYKVIFSRDPIVLFTLIPFRLFTKIKMIFEIHTLEYFFYK